MPTRDAALLFKFKNALAQLREELLARSSQIVVSPGHRSSDDNGGEYPPITADQLIVIRQHSPKRRGKLLTSESLF